MAKWHQVAEVAIVLCVIALAILIFGISGVPYCLYHCLSYYVKGHCLLNQQNVCSKNQKFAPSNVWKGKAAKIIVIKKVCKC